MFQLHAFAPGFLLGLVTVAALATEPAEPGTGGTGEGAGGPAALPDSQRDVDFDVQSTTSTSFVNIPNSVVTIDNGTSTRNVVVTFSAVSQVGDPGDIFALAFRIDNSLVCTATGGPLFFAGSTEVETRTAVHVLTIGPGTHTIRPCWRLNSDGTINPISVSSRSFIAEGRTR